MLPTLLLYYEPLSRCITPVLRLRCAVSACSSYDRLDGLTAPAVGGKQRCEKQVVNEFGTGLQRLDYSAGGGGPCVTFVSFSPFIPFSSLGHAAPMYSGAVCCLCLLVRSPPTSRSHFILTALFSKRCVYKYKSWRNIVHRLKLQALHHQICTETRPKGVHTRAGASGYHILICILEI